jgi:hypothetical protein
MKQLDKQNCEDLIKECINLVKQKKSDFFVLKKLRGVMGYCYWDWIELDPRKEFLPTSIHECLHYLYPDWSESMILYAESRIMNQVEFIKLMEFISILSSKLYIKEKNKKRNKKNKDKK